MPEEKSVGWQVWDVDSANLVEEFDTQIEALGFVLWCAREHCAECAEDFQVIPIYNRTFVPHDHQPGNQSFYPFVITEETDCACCGSHFEVKWGWAFFRCREHKGQHLLCHGCNETYEWSECDHPKEPRDTKCFRY